MKIAAAAVPRSLEYVEGDDVCCAPERQGLHPHSNTCQARESTRRMSATTDRHGFVLYPGNTVVKIADNSTFVVSEVLTLDSSPVVYLLKDGCSGVVDASLVTLTEEKKDRNSWKRATFCEVCFNHYDAGVTWFESPFKHPK